MSIGTKRHPLVSLDDGSSEVAAKNDGAMVGITGSMDRLGRLAFIIRTPSKPAAVERVLRFSRKRQPDGFGDVILALIKWRFPAETMAESLQVQLASSIVYRRDRLLYQVNHEAKLNAERDDCSISVTNLTSPQSDVWREALAVPEQHQTTVPTQAQRIATAAPAASSLHRQALLHGKVPESSRNDDTKSDATSSRSNNPFIAAEYPEAPVVPRQQSDAKCTICHVPKPRAILVNKKKWR
jgi:hypothetical protein